jgi:DNA-3-methyladenine glycosylase II
MSVEAVLTARSFREHALEMAGRDDALGAVVDDYGMPAFWHRPASFATLALLVVEQQVSLASAKAVFDRLTTSLGAVTPASLLRAEPETLSQAGLTRQKQRYLRLLAAAVAEGLLDIPELAQRSDVEARRSLLAMTGIGPWTADAYLLSALRRPDIWPSGDRALQVGVSEVLGLDDVPKATQLDVLGARWQPRRAVAARLVWHAYLCRRGRTETMVTGLDL